MVFKANCGFSAELRCKLTSVSVETLSNSASAGGGANFQAIGGDTHDQK